MIRTNAPGRGWSNLALALVATFLACAPGLVRAEAQAPILVVVESADAYGNIPKIRAGIARELGIPAISLIESQGHPTIGTLQVAIARGGTRASIHFVPSDGVAFAVLINVSADRRPDRLGEWLVAPCVSAVRTSEQRRQARAGNSELLDPWLRARTGGDVASPEVLDPFVGDPPRRVRVTVSDYYLGPEVLDPWSDAVAEYQRDSAIELAVPPRRSRVTPTPPRSPRSR